MKNKILWLLCILIIFVGETAFAQVPAAEKQEERFIFTKRKFTQRQHWYWGIGAVVSDIPVLESRFKLPFSQILYEYNTGDLNKPIRFSIGAGFYGLKALLPVPAIQPSLYIGSEDNDVMGRFSVGGFSDIVVGGHSGLLLAAGMVVKNRLDISFIIIPFGTQPVLPYPSILGGLKEEFIDPANVSYNLDPNKKSLIRYDNQHRHPDDPKYDQNNPSTVYYYSTWDIAYGNGEYSNDKRANPGDFDYLKPRDYIKFPYFGLMVSFRH